MSQFRPMLAAKAGTLKFPYMVSPKIDGIRCVIKDGVALSRTLKPIKNEYIQEVLGQDKFSGFDGELTLGATPTDAEFRDSVSVVMSKSHEREREFRFNVFDDFTEPFWQFVTRTRVASERVQEANNPHLLYVKHEHVFNQEELDELESRVLNQGYEGLILRTRNSDYKFGRATVSQDSLLKLKRFTDDESIVIGFEELLKNNNEKTQSELGLSERSSHKDNKTPMDTLGAVLVKDCETGVEFAIGTGFTQAERKHIWENQDKFTGNKLTYKHFQIGVHEKPRHPVFKSWRLD